MRSARRHTIIIAQDALQVIIDDAAQSKEHGVEAGGSLIGFQDAEVTHILYAVDTGKSASQSGTGIVTDASHQTESTSLIQKIWSSAGVRLGFLGDWHLHPMFLRTLSRTDEETARLILEDHSGLLGLPVILVTYQERRAEIIAYWATLRGGTLHVCEASLQVMGHDHPEVSNALRGHGYIPLRHIREMRLMADRDYGRHFRPHMKAGDQTLVVRLGRLSEEMAELQYVFGVGPQLNFTPAGDIALQLTVDRCSYILVLPPEFPLNPPSIFQRRTPGGRYVGVSCRTSWNSHVRIADLLTRIIAVSRARSLSRRSLRVRR